MRGRGSELRGKVQNCQEAEELEMGGKEERCARRWDWKRLALEAEHGNKDADLAKQWSWSVPVGSKE